MRLMRLEYGSKPMGVAIAHELMMIATGLEIIRRDSEKKIRKTLIRIDELIAEYNIGKIVLGLPKNMNNTLGERAEKSLELKETLERRTGLEVIMWDERLSTVSAHKAMMEAGIRREDRGNYVDSIAAAIILQGYLDSVAGSAAEGKEE